MFVPITCIQEHHIKQNVSNTDDRDHGHYANCPLYHFDVIKCKLFGSISIARLDALESKAQFANKKTVASTIVFSLYTSSQLVKRHEMSQEADQASEFVNL